MPARLPPEHDPSRSFVIRSNAFEFWLAIAGIVTAIQYVTVPEVRGLTSAGQIDSTFAWAWMLLYLLGSIGMISGLLRLSDRIEIAGLILFGVACLVNCVAILQIKGASSGGAYVAFNFFGLAMASASMISVRLRVRKVLSDRSIEE